MKPRRYPSLVNTLFMGGAPAAVLLAALLACADYLAARREVLHGVRRELGILAGQAGSTLGGFISHRREDVRILVDSPLLQDYFKNRDYGLRQEAEAYRLEISKYFAVFARRAGVYSRISYVDDRGIEQSAGTPEGPVPPAPGVHPAGVFPLRAGTIEDDGISGPDAREITYMAAVTYEGRMRGRIVMACRLEPMLHLLSGARVGTQGQAFLLDQQEALLLASGPPLDRALAAEAPIPGTPWKVRLMASPQEFLRPLRRVQQWMALFFLAVVLPALVLMVRRIRHAVRPIEEMAEGTKRLAAGDLDFRFDPPPVQELKVLGEAFNDMASSLQERTRELESRIQLLSALREMDKSVLQGLDEENILRTCLAAASAGLRFDRTALYWLDAARGEIVGRYLHGSQPLALTEAAFQRRRLPLEGPDILAQVVRSRQAVLMKDPGRDPSVNQEFVRESATREFVLAPICGKERVYGVIAGDNFKSGRPLAEPDREGLSLFATATGLTLENAMLFGHLAQSEARYWSVVENSPTVAILGLSKDQHITTWGRGAQGIFGYSAEEIVGKPLRALFPPEADDAAQRLVAEVMAKGTVHESPMPGLRKDGERLELSLSWGGAHQDFWMNREWTVVIRDVTESHKLQRRLLQTEKLSAVGQLISSIAHELNNPLQGVVGYAQLASDPQEQGPDHRRQLHEDLRQVLENAQRCRKIIENLLLFVRQGALSREPISLAPAIRAALELLEYKLKKTDAVQVTVRLPKGLPRVTANLQQFQQVFLNLVNNACDAMAGQRTPKGVTIAARREGAWVRVEVSDTGPGIPAGLRARVFEPFYTTKPEGRGTGLGLPICRQIIEESGGRIGLEEAPGGGALFRILLPIAAAAGPPKRVSAPAPPRLKGRRVLVVDDEPAVLSLLSQVLEREGHAVDAAASLSEARRCSCAARYDLVVTDFHLGDGSGLDLYGLWPVPRPLFIVVTGDVLNPATQQAIDRLSLPLLYKPVDLSAFRKAVRELLAWGKAGVRHGA